jgi:4-hydroxy-tetrahydrodipicolinate synthase
VNDEEKQVTKMREGKLILQGAMTAIVTPFLPDGGLDLPALEALVRWQIEEGINGLVPCGTTGEGATLDDEEKRQVFATVVKAAAGKVPVIAGVGSNSTRATLASARIAAETGADALLVVSPYYNKPNRSGMIAHYEAVADATELPVVVYNVPGRTGQNLGAGLILRLAQIPGIIAVKEASGNLDQIAAIIEGRPDRFALLSGDDALTLPTIALGAEGVISVVSNEAPREMAQLVEAARKSDFENARRLHYRLLPLMRANFAETNPVPVKAAMALLGRCGAALRPPLGPPEERTRELLRDVLKKAGLDGGAL